MADCTAVQVQCSAGEGDVERRLWLQVLLRMEV